MISNSKNLENNISNHISSGAHRKAQSEKNKQTLLVGYFSVKTN